MPEKIIPKCPCCNKRVGNWLEGTASYTCRNCKTEFIIGEGFVTILTPHIVDKRLTSTASCAISKS